MHACVDRLVQKQTIQMLINLQEIKLLEPLLSVSEEEIGVLGVELQGLPDVRPSRGPWGELELAAALMELVTDLVLRDPDEEIGYCQTYKKGAGNGTSHPHIVAEMRSYCTCYKGKWRWKNNGAERERERCFLINGSMGKL